MQRRPAEEGVVRGRPGARPRAADPGRADGGPGPHTAASVSKADVGGLLASHPLLIHLLDIVDRIWDYLVTSTRDDHKTVIITTHYIEEARQAHTVSRDRRSERGRQGGERYRYTQGPCCCR